MPEKQEKAAVTTTQWHYTIGTKLVQIIKSGKILPATAGVRGKEKPVVWFSSREDWEPTANKLLVNETTGAFHSCTKEETHELGGGLVRIGVAPEIAGHDWKAFKQESGISRKVAHGLYNAAVSQGSRPGDWYVSFSPVPRSQWLAIELWDGSQWVPVKQDEWDDLLAKLEETETE